MFNEEYYKSGNYKNYLQNQKKYKKLSNEIFSLLNFLSINNKDINILDYGCAVGHLLDGIKECGFKNSKGYDISEWAISVASKKHKMLSFNEIFNEIYDIIFMLDVLEHINDSDINDIFSKIKTKILIVRIPVSNNGGKNFVLDVSNADVTHINCKEKKEWINILDNFGYYIFPLNLTSIYDSEGVFSAICFSKFY